MNEQSTVLFRIFNEIAIIDQLSTAALARRLPVGVHTSQFALLSHLMRRGKEGETPAALTQALQVPKTSMTNTLMQLEKRGLIDVRPDAKDRRKKQVFIMKTGQELYLKTVSLMVEPILQITKGLDGLEEILPILENLRKRLDENRDV